MHDIDDELLARIPGPLVVLGASGFVGANLFKRLIKVRPDVYGTYHAAAGWRLVGDPQDRLIAFDATLSSDIRKVAAMEPGAVFDCTSYGAYSFETDYERIYSVNVTARARLLEALTGHNLSAFVSAGSSSEYGLNSAAPSEHHILVPNSHYAVSKAAAGNLITYFGKVRQLPCVHLRLYSVYGPWEDNSRLIPTLACAINAGHLPTFADADTARDFVHADDVCNALILAAAKMHPELYGETFNIGTGQETTLAALAALCKERFGIAEEPQFGSFTRRHWDVTRWRANPAKALDLLGWQPSIPLAEGLQATCDWWRDSATGTKKPAATATPKGMCAVARRNSVSAIVACYKDALAIPIMYERLSNTFRKIGVDYEIIFVNDGSPDNDAEEILKVSRKDPNVIGICHSRNFGSQNAFRSGMEFSTKESVVLLDGDLQDPPELIEEFVERWKKGCDVVYGTRVSREMSPHQHMLYKAFYRFFRRFSYIDMPVDAGDFSLIDRKAVNWMLQCKERDVFLRGLRSYVGFKQVGVPYIRPERMFGRSTNNFFRNLGWAKKGILSFSFVPLNALTFFSAALFIIMVTVMMAVVILRLFWPELAPEGAPTLLLGILFFGILNLMGISIVGEYVGKIVEEVKARPAFIRASVIRHGEINDH